MNQKIRFCTSADGTRIAYATAGTGAPIVRVANWLTHLELDWKGPIWSHWFEALSRKRQLVRYDLRGSGLSERSVDDLSLDAWIRDLEAVVDDLELEHFSLMGFCQGGVIAAAYAARHPDRVNRLVLYDSYTHGAFTEGATYFQRMKMETLAQLIRIGWGQSNAAFRKVFASLLMPEGSEEQQTWLAELERRSTTTEMAVHLWKAFHRVDIRDVAPNVRAPALVFHVKNDAMVPFEEGCHLAELIPNARFVPLEGENHILRSDEPAWEQFVSELQSFLGQSDERPLLREDGFSELTPREHEVLDLMAEGLSNAQIAERLFISPKTVRNHITRIFDKLHVSRRAEAIVQAREVGFGRNGTS